MMSQLLPLGDVKKYFCHLGKYNVSGGWPRETILLLNYEEQTDDVDNLAEDISSVTLSSQDSSRSSSSSSSSAAPVWKRYDNVPGKHAEKVMLEDLRETLQCLKPCSPGEQEIVKVVLKIVLSYSPCNEEGHECAQLLVAFKNAVQAKTSANVEISVQIANFYLIYKETNIRGLCLLLKNGIDLQVFAGHDAWKPFLKEVGLRYKTEIKERIEERANREIADKLILDGLRIIKPLVSTEQIIPSEFRKMCKEKLTNEELRKQLKETKKYVAKH